MENGFLNQLSLHDRSYFLWSIETVIIVRSVYVECKLKGFLKVLIPSVITCSQTAHD